MTKTHTPCRETAGPIEPDGTDQYVEEVKRVARQIAAERGLDPNNLTEAQAKEIADLAIQRTWFEAPAGKHFILRVSKFSAGIDYWCIGMRLNPDIVSAQCDPLAQYRAELPINQLMPPGGEGQTEISPLGHGGYLASPDGRTFYGRLSMLHFEVNRFQMVQLQGSSGSYLAEGTCYPQ